MRVGWLLWCVLVVASDAGSQTTAGVITGVVSDPEGAPFANAFVQLKAAGASTVVNAVSGTDGRYTVSGIPSGTYELTVNVPGMKSFTRTSLALGAGTTLRVDARLEDGPSLRTIGEDPATIAAVFINRPPPPTGPTPRLPSGKPDLSGTWMGGPGQLPSLGMLPWADALTRERQQNDSKDYPPTYCLPSGPVPLLSAGFFGIVHGAAALVLIVDEETPGFRQVFIDGRDHPRNVESTWMGHSTGRWEGDTLVVESVGFRDRGWIDFSGHPHSAMLHVVHRLTRLDLGHLDIEITVTDPGVYRAPWTVKKSAVLAPNEDIREYVCNENNKDLARPAQ
jgi:hypothetical protein